MEKVLNINNKKELEKFYKMLWLYKSILYRNVIFNLKKDMYNLNTIITALNIKSKKQRISYIYDEACREVDNFYKNKDICGFKNGKCYSQQKLNYDLYNGCCRKCAYQSNRGCKTKNLTCKLYVCSEVKKRIKTIELKNLNILKCLSYRQRIIIKHNFFSSKEDIINDLYIGSICIFTIRILYRWITKSLIFTKEKQTR